MIQAVTTIAAIIVAALAIFEGKLWRENAKLKKKLRRRTLDCLAFYEIEYRLCDACASAHALGCETAYATKRLIRSAIRADGMQSPSEDCTPHRLAEDLQEL